MQAVSTLQLRKARPTRLRDVGFGELWLQNEIAKDPTLLGLGELHLIQKERLQPSGGRIDLLMSDPETDTRYEIEIMLGATNESHIIRTIEYWDIERQRYPLFEHRAVIVAEQITARFFNVIRLLNRAVPIIAIQLSAFIIDESIVLHFTRVLDTYEFGGEAEDEEPGEQADRSYWDRRANPESLAVVDAVVGLLSSEAAEPRLTYNKFHIALGTSGYNFCWFHPRRASHCHIHVKVPPDDRPSIIEKLEAEGIDVANQGRSSVRLRLTKTDLIQHREALVHLLQIAEQHSHR